ncbi:helix-turn-helix domain-containing protein, partial [Paramaledivibacter caminithermalis]
RKRLAISQYELGKKVNLDQTLISRIERGARNLKADEIVLFAKALEVDISELLDVSA